MDQATPAHTGALPATVPNGAVPQAEPFVGEHRFVQLSLDDAIRQGEAGMAQAAEAATRRDPLFRERAEAVMLQHLSTRPDRSAWGEDLTDIARAHGCTPPDDRAFGAVFQSLARRGLIRCVEFGVRRKGRGTAGARRWALCQ